MTFEKFVTEFVSLHDKAKKIPLGGYKQPQWLSLRTNAPVAVLFSAHPDDEILSFSPLAMLFRRSGWRVINVAMTLGQRGQRTRRRNELENACAFLGYELLIPNEMGFESVRRNTHGSFMWKECEQTIAAIIRQKQPRVIITHHVADAHPSHEGTNLIVREAMRHLPWSGLFFESEYWHEMRKPNLMVEVTMTDLTNMLKALSFHEGELERNSYHVSWLSGLYDNVRRSEVVFEFGSSYVQMDFAAMYLRSVCQDGMTTPTSARAGRILHAHQDVASVLV